MAKESLVYILGISRKHRREWGSKGIQRKESHDNMNSIP